MKTGSKVFISAILFMIGLSLPQYLWGQALLVRPYLSDSNEFFVTSPASGEWLGKNELKIFLFDQVKLNAGQKTADTVRQSVQNFFADPSKFWKVMQEIFPEARKMIAKKKIFIAIDDLGTKRSLQRSFHLKDTPESGESLIIIDFLEFRSNYWQALLGHEIIHALLADMKTPIWVEEILAQQFEKSLSGILPIERIVKLRDLHSLPSPISNERPFKNHETYGINFLFGQYMIEKMGGFSVMRALNPLIEDSRCSGEFDLPQILCRIQFFAKDSGWSGPRLDWLTPQSLLTNFTMAMVLNRTEKKSMGFYKVPHWPGFTQSKEIPLDEDLFNSANEPGSFIRVKIPTTAGPSLDTFEQYPVFYNLSSYVILDSQSFTGPNSQFQFQDLIYLRAW